MKKFFNKGDRITKFYLIVILIFLVLASRLFYLQIINGNKYREQATKNSLRSEVIPTLRGKIYDRNGILLATNTTGYRLVYENAGYISKEEYNDLKTLINSKENKENLIDSFDTTQKTKNKIKKVYEDIEELSDISQIEPMDILHTLYTTPATGIDKKIIISEDLDPKVALLKSEELTNKDINIEEYDKRYYPFNKIASHVIGNVKLISDTEYNELRDKGYGKFDIIGKKGIEKQYDEEMRGVFGKEYVEVDVKGNVINRIKEIEPKQGANIYLNIDERLQKIMTDAFAEKFGTFIAMEVKTGKIITMVSSPEINLNILSSRISKKQWDSYLKSKELPLINKAISGLYPPGSIFKAISGAAILEGGIDPNETMLSDGIYRYGKSIFRDAHRKGYGITNFYKSIEESVNTYYYTFINKIDKDILFKLAKEFNIGSKTGIDIPGELSGILPTPEWKKERFKNRVDKLWYPGDLINMSIGQGFLLVTPIQMVSVYQTIANNGVMLRPELVDKIVYPNKTIYIKPTVERKVSISDKNLKILQKALTLPVKGKKGTARILDLSYVDVSAKTGTAQNESKLNHSWMSGYFPSKNPEIAFVALVPNGGYGGVEAGEKVKQFIEAYYNREEINGKENQTNK